MNEEVMALLERLVNAVELIASECESIRYVSDSVDECTKEIERIRTKGVTVYNDCM